MIIETVWNFSRIFLARQYRCYIQAFFIESLPRSRLEVLDRIKERHMPQNSSEFRHSSGMQKVQDPTVSNLAQRFVPVISLS